MKKKVAVYPISANPPTWGHADILFRAASHFEHIYWAAAINPRKEYFFSEEERLIMLNAYVEHYGLTNVTVESFTGSTARYAESKEAYVILKGMRNESDFQTELEQSEGNQGILPKLETFCLFSQAKYSRISSTLVRELAFLQEDISPYVIERVAKMMKDVANTRSYQPKHI